MMVLFDVVQSATVDREAITIMSINTAAAVFTLVMMIVPVDILLGSLLQLLLALLLVQRCHDDFGRGFLRGAWGAFHIHVLIFAAA